LGYYGRLLLMFKAFTRARTLFNTSSYSDLTRTGASSNENLGYLTALAGDKSTLVAGVPGYNSNQGGYVVYTYNNNKTWSYQTLLTYGVAGDGWGGANGSVAISNDGNTIVVGNSVKKIVLVWERSGTTWTNTKVWTDPYLKTAWGRSVAIRPDAALIVVGWAGGIHTFTKTGGTWNSTATQQMGPTPASTYYGYSLAFSKDGTYFAVSNRVITGGGNVVLFSNGGGTGTSYFSYYTITNSNSYAFGDSLALSSNGSRIVIGQGDNKTVFVYDYNAGVTNYTLTSTITAKNTMNSTTGNFGRSVGISSDGLTIVTGNENVSYDKSNATYQGAVYVYKYLNNNNWRENILIRPTTVSNGDSVVISSDGTIVGSGAAGSSTGGVTSNGLVNVFYRR
jgi:hypothetical protein